MRYRYLCVTLMTIALKCRLRRRPPLIPLLGVVELHPPGVDDHNAVLKHLVELLLNSSLLVEADIFQPILA